MKAPKSAPDVSDCSNRYPTYRVIVWVCPTTSPATMLSAPNSPSTRAVVSVIP